MQFVSDLDALLLSQCPLTSLSLSLGLGFDSNSLEKLRAFPTLRSLSFHFRYASMIDSLSRACAVLPYLPCLTSLDIDSRTPSTLISSRLKQIADSKLQSFTLSSTGSDTLTDSHLSILSHSSSLTHLDLSCEDETAVTGSFVLSFTNALKTLRLGLNISVENPANLTRYETADLPLAHFFEKEEQDTWRVATPNFPPDLLPEIGKLTSLTDLKLCFRVRADTDVGVFSLLTNLTQLKLTLYEDPEVVSREPEWICSLSPSLLHLCLVFGHRIQPASGIGVKHPKSYTRCLQKIADSLPHLNKLGLDIEAADLHLDDLRRVSHLPLNEIHLPSMIGVTESVTSITGVIESFTSFISVTESLIRKMLPRVKYSQFGGLTDDSLSY